MKPIVRVGSGERKFAPPIQERSTKFAPPYKEKGTSNEIKNQKTQSIALKLSGVRKRTRGNGPRLSDVREGDLKSLSALENLFNQAVKAGWLRSSEANFLNFVGAAVRAKDIGAHDPVRVFVSIVKEGRWEVITQAQEDRARTAIRRARDRVSINEPVTLSLLK